MLVNYTPISSLSPAELEGLRSAVRGITLETRGGAFSWNGKVFNMNELIAQKKFWENPKPTNSTNILLG